MQTQKSCHFPTWNDQIKKEEAADRAREQASAPVQPKVIYGEDNRKDLYETKDPADKKLAASTVALFRSSDVREQDGIAQLTTKKYRVCAKEPFSPQETGAFCSGSLVGEDLIMTAGHCISKSDEGKVKFVFGFGIDQAGGKTPTSVPASNVYTAAKVLSSVIDNGTGTDYALVRLDRKVEGRAPLAVDTTGDAKAGDPMTVIGHPSGLPTKVADGATVRSASPVGYYVTNLDTYGGNSGSAVFNSKTKLVEGILVRGENDFVWDSKDSCQVSYRVGDDAGRGEDVTKISRVREALEAARAGDVAAVRRTKAGSFSTKQVAAGIYSQVWAMLQEANRADVADEAALVDRTFLSAQEIALLPVIFRDVAAGVAPNAHGMKRNDEVCRAITRVITDSMVKVAGSGRDARFIAIDEIATIRSMVTREVIVRTIENLYGDEMRAGGSYERFARHRRRLIGE